MDIDRAVCPVFMCVFMCVCYIYTPRGVYMTTTPPPLSSILYPRLASRAPIHPSSMSRFLRGQHSDGWRVQPTIYIDRSHTRIHIYIGARRVRIRPLVRAFATDARLKARSRRQGRGRRIDRSIDTPTRDDDDGGMYSTMAPVTCHRTMTTTTTTTPWTTTRRATIARAGGASQGNDATRRDGDTRVFQKML